MNAAKAAGRVQWRTVLRGADCGDHRPLALPLVLGGRHGASADSRGDSRQKRGNTAAKSGDLSKKLSRIWSQSSLCGGIH
jgi:hypothetical protein